MLEPVRIGQEGGIQSGLADDPQVCCQAVVDAVRCHVGDATGAVLVVVPGEEGLAVGTRVFDAAEARGELGSVLQGFELRLRVRVVVRDVGSAVALGDIEIDQQAGHRLGAHGGTAIGMQGQPARLDIMARHGVSDELLGQLRTLARGDEPAHDEAAEDVQDDVQVEARPLGRSLELGDIPGPDLVGRDGQQFGLGVGRVGELVAPLLLTASIVLAGYVGGMFLPGDQLRIEDRFTAACWIFLRP